MQRHRQGRRNAGSRSARRASRRSRKSLLLVFALIFAPAAARSARAACVEFTSPHPISGETDGARSVFAADLDGDGDLDTLSASFLTDRIAWHENNGGGAGWTLHTISTVAIDVSSVVAADVDGDGDLDAISGSGGDSVDWFENDGAAAGWDRHNISTAVDAVRSVFAADVDGDGHIDVLSASDYDSKIAWFENSDASGSGATWVLHTISIAATRAYSVFAADVDGDGDLDALSASQNDDKIAWYENLGPGNGSSWTLHTISTGANGAWAVFAADLDGDGDRDALAVSRFDDQVAWYENRDGDGSDWTLHVISTLADGVRSVFAADLDGDGDLDALSASARDDKVAWYENQSSGASWTLHTLSTGADYAFSVVAADLDGDGDLDAVSASYYDDRIAWYRNDRLHDQPLFAGAATITSAVDGPRSVCAVDVDSDGDTDALSASAGDTIAWHENDSSATNWILHTISVAADVALSVAAADVDGDGDVDALSASFFDDTIAWYESNSGGASWTLRTISLAAYGATSVFAADVDGDGDFDALSASSDDSKIAWYENHGAGASWTLHTISLAADGAWSVFAADVDGDGDLDALSASRNDDKIAWYDNLPPGDGSSWAQHTISLSADNASSVFAADVDGDGDLDVLSASYFDGKIAWHENLDPGNGSSWTQHTISTAALNALSVFAADLDGDGDLDALAASVAGDRIAWHENLPPGDGSAWTAHAISTANDASSVLAADLDGDGDLDALSASFSSDAVFWHPNLGTGVFDDGFDSDSNKACWSGSTP